MYRDIAPRHIKGNFEPSDRLAVVLVNKRTGAVTQRIASAERIAAPEFQAWLRYKNVHGFDVYVSMNALKPEAQGRTKEDIGTIRHIYLDLDNDGTAALHRVFTRAKADEIPAPSYIVNTSPDKWHVLWRVKDFTKEEAEHLQKNLAREMDADPAATDCSRVLRLPGFCNRKYPIAYWVQVEAHSGGIIYRPADFPEYPKNRSIAEILRLRSGSAPRKEGVISQSERDWAYAKRALDRGETPSTVIQAIAERRKDEKSNPAYYAELTVRKAAAELAQDEADRSMPYR